MWSLSQDELVKKRGFDFLADRIQKKREQTSSRRRILQMIPTYHLLVSGTLAVGVYQASGSWESGVATVAAGVLPDADHLLDYYNWLVRRRTNHMFYLFHGWEYIGLFLVAAALLSWPAIVIGVTLGYASHVVGDYLTHHRRAASYSLFYRARHGFRSRSILPDHLYDRFEANSRLIRGYDGSASMVWVLRTLLLRCLPLPRGVGMRRDNRGKRHSL